MRISRAYNFIYFSIPKTGSESVRKLLDPYSDVNIVIYNKIDKNNPFYSHMRPCEVANIASRYSVDFDNSFKFATVRNPWARMASFYLMIKRTRRDEGYNFSSWLERVANGALPVQPTDKKWYDHGFMRVEEFCSDENSNSLVDSYYRLEDQKPQMVRDLIDIGVPFDPSVEVPFINTAPSTYEYKDMYSDVEIGIVKTIFENEIERFKYRF